MLLPIYNTPHSRHVHGRSILNACARLALEPAKARGRVGLVPVSWMLGKRVQKGQELRSSLVRESSRPRRTGPRHLPIYRSARATLPLRYIPILKQFADPQRRNTGRLFSSLYIDTLCTKYHRHTRSLNVTASH